MSVTDPANTVARPVVAEFVGTALLLATVVGSGIMGERLAGGNVAIALLANALATGAALVALILTFGSVSGAHFNPVVTVADASGGGLPWRVVLATWPLRLLELSRASPPRTSCLESPSSRLPPTNGLVLLSC